MKAVSLLVVLILGASPAFAQHAPIRASIEKAAEAAAEQTASKSARGSDRGHTSGLFWSGVALGIAGVTTSALGLTAFRSEDSSTGNAPKSTYAACVAQKNSDPVYATNQCGVLKGKNLKLLWGGVALGGAGAALMIGGRDTSAELSPGTIGVFHRWHF